MQHVESSIRSDVPIVVWSPANGVDFNLKDLVDYLASSKDRFNKQLEDRGGILLRGFDCVSDVVDYQSVLDTIAPDLLEYVGGTSPRKVVSGRIMTATEIPGNCSIPLHQEMSYTDNSPSRISFFCEVPPNDGGETTIGDMRSITRQIDMEVRDRFKDHGGVQLCRNLPLPEHVDSRPGVPKPWTEVFDTMERDRAEEIAVNNGWKFDWREDGSMLLQQEVRASTRKHPRTGEDIWFNQVHIFSPVTAIKWACDDHRSEAARRLSRALSDSPELLDNMQFGDGTRIEDDDLLHIYDVLSRNSFPLAWQKGDVLILDNILVGHGRCQFTGDRRILTALIQ